MTNISTAISDLPPEQRAIRDKCFHPTGRFVEFKREEIEQTIPERFEQMVRLYPDNLAVRSRSCELTYEQLNKTANWVADAILAKRGEGQETIALLLEHDAPAIASILGIIKAGKIYVALDASLPQSRVIHILEESQASLIVTNKKNLFLAKELSRNVLHFIDIDEHGRSVPDHNPGLTILPDALASIIYTSGSSGKVKGIVQNHRNVLHRIMNYTNNLHIGSDDRLVLLYSLMFNGGAYDIFNALLNGASLYPLDIKSEGLAGLAGWLARQEITLYHSVATVFRHFVDTLTGSEEFPKLRAISLGGEPVYKRDVDSYKRYFSKDCIFVNRLGTSETGRIRWNLIERETKIVGNLVPVGYPVTDNEVLLLDEAGHEVGLGDIGEIAVKSRFLSPGYWRRPDLTQAKFLPDPEGENERIYLTGDLGRMSEDGCLEHLGRKDLQVKIRGYRIEISEVEMALLDHAAVREAVVVARENLPGDKRLVAYIVPTRQPAPTINELRGFLKQKLPEYMIPSVFVMSDSLPLTSTGKVDRQALPIPGRSRPKLNTLFVAPGTPVEEKLAEIWAEVVGVDQVGIHDNFFNLGGHSLAATRVVSRVIDRFKVELPIQTLFDSPTVADMAVVITENMAKKAGGEKLARMLAELESISDEEARDLQMKRLGKSQRSE